LPCLPLAEEFAHLIRFENAWQPDKVKLFIAAGGGGKPELLAVK
jgi:hypothetical protein